MNNPTIRSQIIEMLEAANIRFGEEAFIEGFAADFVVFAADEQFALIETKAWQWHAGNVSRAGDLARLIQQRTGADVVFVVLENLERNWPSRHVYTIGGVLEGVKGWLKEKREDIKIKVPSGTLAFSGRTPTTSKTLFAAMPFDGKYDDTFIFAMTSAAKAIGAKAIRVDEEDFTEEIVDRIKSDIAHCDVLVADLSKSRPNVLYELGYARGLGKPCAQVCSTSLKRLPFDVEHFPTIEYKIGGISRLTPKLIKRVKGITGSS